VRPPRNGRDATLALIHNIEQRPRVDEGSGDVGLADALQRTHRVATRRGLVVVISDFLDNSDWGRELRALATRHDVIAAPVRDPREAELPPVGLLMLVDPESGRRVEVQTNSRKLRERYAAAARTQQERITRAVRAAGASHLVLSTDRDWLIDVARFTVARRRR